MNPDPQNLSETGAKRLALVIILFVVTMLTVVGFIVGLEFHMVTENHYEEAENNQQQIDHIERADSLEQTVKSTT